MQDRYVGDVGDFGKYALLRRLAGHPEEWSARLGIVWCYFPNENHNADGKHVSYLDQSRFNALDDELFVSLRRLVSSRRRSIASVEAARLFDPRTVFCSNPVVSSVMGTSTWHDRLSHRDQWLRDCLRKTTKCDLVFFDPDNGIETPSFPKRHPKAGKYIFWDELRRFWERGQDLLIYHHLHRRSTSSDQVATLVENVDQKLQGAESLPLVFVRGSRRIFLLVHHGGARGRQFEQRARTHLQVWSQHFHC